ncbi:VWA domain-containing protein [Aurantimonas sp. C2-6-R+9]|uniref:vWA domain-containing protein n=1 Tax=unclassified Aurantimonas TaxID=2638230 RepID=UPI002E193F3A|nr:MULTISPECIES: VWA domain-containing protein [unclassified Aurantimonas]MEC5291512.1 VWA domain-containing protein [Aurantimonas sp. C2-3-R2]MEC5381660.1 VWA domain-containing protein [Aurantimonas sp. C2-6-R+9]MEC5412598.1 VWA domain-containing protein [Aurantimonas sp. C2-4-R8]
MSAAGPAPALVPGEPEALSALVADKLAAFLRTLRDNAFAVGLSEGQDAAMLLASGYGDRPGLLRAAFKHLFAARKADWEVFDGLFDAFWLGKRVRSRSAISGSTRAADSPSLKNLRNDAAHSGGDTAPDQMPAGDEPGEDRDGVGRMEGASRADNLSETDFRKIAGPAQIAAAHDIAARLARTMRTRLTRRDLARRRGYRLDLRRTIHRNISHGGVPISLVKRRRKEKPLRLVMLLDASGSMSLYTGVFLRFIHGVLDEFREADAFLFHTRLAHVSDAMKERNPVRALDRLSMMAQGAGGGTRIGESLQTFNRWHAARVIHSRTCVMIVSDGYETGDAALLGREMARLSRRCRRIVWLNPMIGWEGYAPEAAGIKAALPHVDLYAPAHTLQSLADLEPYLAKL